MEADIIGDSNGKVILLFAGHVVIDGLDLGRGGILGAETVAPSQDRQMQPGLQYSRADILKERFAQGAGLLGAVKHREDFAAFGDCGGKMLQGEWAVEVHLHKADLFAKCGKVIHHLPR